MNDTVGQIVLIVVIAIIVVFVLVVVGRSVRIIPQARAGVVERLGRYHKTLMPGLNILVPFIDRLRPLIDLREQVVSFPPQPVITEDNLVVSIDTVVFFQVTDARAATYEIANYLGAVEQLATTTLRNVVGGLNLEEALTSRDEINGQLRIVLDEATGKWGIRVSRVELKAIDPPASIQDSMEKQMRAERERRAVILTAEGTKQSAILEAEGHRQGEILRAEGDARAQVLRAEGEAEAITTVFGAIHRGEPDNLLLAYQYLQTLPKIAEGSANKLWVIPSELTEALKGIGQAFGEKGAALAGAAGLGSRDGGDSGGAASGRRAASADDTTAARSDASSAALRDAKAAARSATDAARDAADGTGGIRVTEVAGDEAGGGSPTPGTATPGAPAPGAGTSSTSTPGTAAPGTAAPDTGPTSADDGPDAR